MSASLVIDGYNLIGAFSYNPFHGDMESSRAALIERLKVYKRLKRIKVTVVFDGRYSGRLARGEENMAGVKVVFSRDGEDADTVIKGIIREKGGGVTVVTSDSELASYARAHKAVAVSSGEFLRLLDDAVYEDLKGVSPEEEQEALKTGKKGPSKRPSREIRKKLNRLKKL